MFPIVRPAVCRFCAFDTLCPGATLEIALRSITRHGHEAKLA